MYFLIVSTAILSTMILVNGQMYDDDNYSQAETRLRSDLLGNYNREMLPRVNTSDIVSVKYSVLLRRIEPHKNFKVTVTGVFMFTWKDEFLVYTDKNPQKIKTLRVMTHEIWVPYLTVFNVEGTPPLLNSQATCYLFPTGRVACKRRFNMDAYCVLDYASWPHDNQKCVFYFGTWIDTRVGLVPGAFAPGSKKGFFYNYKMNNRRWLVKNISINAGEQALSEAVGYVALHFELQRKDQGHFSTYVAPAFILSFLTLLPFWLPREKGTTRMAVVLIAMIANVMFIQDIGLTILGWSGDTVPCIAKFYRDEIYVNLFSAFLTAVVRMLCIWEKPVSGFLSATAVFLQQTRACRILLGLQPYKEAQSRPWSPLAGLLDRVGFLFTALITIWMVANLVPSPSIPTDENA